MATMRLSTGERSLKIDGSPVAGGHVTCREDQRKGQMGSPSGDDKMAVANQVADTPPAGA
jgi:hypothetical protein